MSYALSLGSLQIVTDDLVSEKVECTCRRAKELCTPSFVFSVEGQVGFRCALEHLADCNRLECRQLRAHIITSMIGKLEWLMKEECLLGCVHVQPLLYGSKKVIMRRKDFPIIGHHLATCPKESCAQLRRSMLLRIRDELRPN